MIKPNFIEKLLEGVKVEWKALGDVTLPTSNIRWSDTKDTYRYIDLTSVSREKNTIIETTEISAENAPSRARKLVVKNDVIFATTRPTQQRLCLITEEFSGEVASTGYCILRARKDEVLPKWIYHYITSSKFKNYLEENQSGSAYPAISDAKVKEFKIPIPALRVQEEIISVLDTFTELTVELIEELTAELTARKKQYTYYRDKLFTFDEGEVEWKSLGDVGELVRGNGLPKTDFTEIGIPAIHYGQIYTYYGTFTTETKSFVSFETAQKLKKVDTGDVVITNTSENLDDVGKAVVYLGKVPAVTGGHATIFKPSNQISGKYFAYFTQTKMFASQKRKYAKGIKVIDVSATDMSKIIIPIPTLTEQERIVSILDKFDALTSSITKGFPREIELRQKKYEYYRNLLLSFPKSEVEA